MLQNFMILTLCVVAIHAAGEFSVLNSPKGLLFKGNDALPSQYVGDVLSAAMGKAVAGDAEWSGLVVSDPFSLAKGVIAVYVDGVSHVSTNDQVKSYVLEGTSTDESLNAVIAELETTNDPVCNIDFNEYAVGVDEFTTCFGEISVQAVRPTKYLNPALHNADKQFLQTIGYINAAAENLADMVKPSNFLVFRLSLESVAKAHGEKGDALAEANKLLSAAVAKLNAAAQKSSNKSVLFVQIANKEVNVGRAKRDVLASSTDNPYNLAEYYNEDYPVIFNIILWFMVTFGFSLLAICYAIGSMDPGRDSIIYRMTSTRMKKDN